MKQFIINTILFLLLVPILFEAYPIYKLFDKRYKREVSGSEIYMAILKTKKKSKAKKIIIGDSVGYQLFNNSDDNDTINSLACNQAISMAGQYILLNEYIETGNKIDTVFMVFSPFTFFNNLDQKYTYHYFLKPFYSEKKYEKYFSELVDNQVSKIPFTFLVKEPYVATSNWAPDFTSSDEINYTFLSPISVEYLTKIYKLSQSHHFKIIMIPTPCSIEFKEKIAHYDKNEIYKNGLTQLFEGYFEKIEYYDISMFEDGTHVYEPEKFTAIYKSKWIK